MRTSPSSNVSFRGGACDASVRLSLAFTDSCPAGARHSNSITAWSSSSHPRVQMERVVAGERGRDVRRGDRQGHAGLGGVRAAGVQGAEEGHQRGGAVRPHATPRAVRSIRGGCDGSVRAGCSSPQGCTCACRWARPTSAWRPWRTTTLTAPTSCPGRSPSTPSVSQPPPTLVAASGPFQHVFLRKLIKSSTRTPVCCAGLVAER
jgi:hypothetical protein